MEYIEEIRTLVVDDSDFFASLAAGQLETEHDIQAVEANSGEEALEILETGSFDCVVSDYDMPEMDGLTLYRRIADTGSDVPFVLLTGRSDAAIVSEAIGLGIDDYLRKEAVSEQDNFEVLANRIENVVSRRKAQQKYETVVDNTPDGIVQIHRDGTLLAANDDLAAMFGRNPDEVVGRSIGTVLPASLADQWRTHGETALGSDDPVSFQSSHDGRHYDVTVVPVESRDDGGTYQLIARDVTGRVERERQLEQTTEQLELINRFVRHDIRNDINLVYAWSEMLADRVTDEDAREYAGKIYEVSEHIIELTDIAHEFVEIVSGVEGVSTKPVPLHTVLDGEFEKRKQSYEEATFVRNHEVPEVRVSANEMLSSVFRNLLNNAVQHNDSDRPEVRLSVDVDEAAGVATVIVADNGPGIPASQREDIFGKGEQGATSSGSGIGLYLVHTLVSQYGGDVQVEDSHLGGAAFVVELPLAET